MKGPGSSSVSSWLEPPRGSGSLPAASSTVSCAVSITSRSLSQAGWSRETTSSHAGSRRPGTSVARDWTRRRCPAGSEQTICTSRRAHAARSPISRHSAGERPRVDAIGDDDAAEHIGCRLERSGLWQDLERDAAPPAHVRRPMDVPQCRSRDRRAARRRQRVRRLSRARFDRAVLSRAAVREGTRRFVRVISGAAGRLKNR